MGEPRSSCSRSPPNSAGVALLSAHRSFPPGCSLSLWSAATPPSFQEVLPNRCASPDVLCSSLAEVYMHLFSLRADVTRQGCRAHEIRQISECSCSVVYSLTASAFYLLVHRAVTSPYSLGRSLSFNARSKGAVWGEMFILPALGPYMLHQFFSFKFFSSAFSKERF